MLLDFTKKNYWTESWYYEKKKVLIIRLKETNLKCYISIMTLSYNFNLLNCDYDFLSHRITSYLMLIMIMR